jgi:hypothetical protein
MMLIASALKGTEKELAQRLQIDILGAQGFIVWILAIIGIGLVGYIPGMTKTSRYMLLLVAVVIVLKNGGLFQQAQLAIQQASSQGPAPSIAQPEASGTSTAPAAAPTSGGGGGPSDLDKGVKAAETAVQVASMVAMVAAI